jgi:hypothetical protein
MSSRINHTAVRFLVAPIMGAAILSGGALGFAGIASAESDKASSSSAHRAGGGGGTTTAQPPSGTATPKPKARVATSDSVTSPSSTTQRPKILTAGPSTKPPSSPPVNVVSTTEVPGVNVVTPTVVPAGAARTSPGPGGGGPLAVPVAPI